MPRRSAASYSTPIIPGERPEPPAHLTTNAMVIWERITATLPVERICDAGFQLLAPHLCQHIHFCEVLGAAAEFALAEPGVLDDDDKRAALCGLLKAHAEQTTAVKSLATKLRMTPQSRYTPDSKAVVRSTGVRPWDDWSNNAKREPPKAS